MIRSIQTQGIQRVCSHLHFDLPGLLGQEAGLLLSFKGLGLDVMRLHCAELESFFSVESAGRRVAMTLIIPGLRCRPN